MKKLSILLIFMASIALAMGVRATSSATSEAVFISTLYPPANLLVESGGEYLEFTWDEPLMGPPLGYNLYYSESPENLESYLLLDSPTSNYAISDAYFDNAGFYVTAIYELGESRRCDIYYLSRLQPVRVQLMIDAGRDSAVLSWEPVRDADSYLVYFSEYPQAEFPAQWQGPIPITEHSFIDPLAQRRFYRVLASASGNGHRQGTNNLRANEPGRN
jgi:hypothetical protein